MTRILVVEDNPSNMKLFRLILHLAGYEVLEAHDGAGGVEVAKAELPDLVIMDIQLPVMDGMEAFQSLQADPVTRNIPAIAVTSYAMKGDEEKLLAMGFASYLPKPVHRGEFLQTISTLLGAR